LKLIDLYEAIVRIGMKHDPRPRKELSKILSEKKRQFKGLKGSKKKIFDKDSLFNPYDDTRILYGDGDREIKSIMVGVDMDTPELLLADRLSQAGNEIDLVMSHHPRGKALVNLFNVMNLQTSVLKRLGVIAPMADELMKERISEVERSLHSTNSMRSVDAARLLNLPYMCAHTVADNMVNDFLQRLINRKRPKTLGALVDLFQGIEEYGLGSRLSMGPKIIIGDRKKDAGKIFIDMTGGTEGSKRIFSRLSQAGVNTIVSMHLSEGHYKQAKQEHINVVIAGHIPSDNIGLNLLLDELIKTEDIGIIPSSGFTRVARR